MMPRPSFCALLNKFGDSELDCVEVGVDEGLNAKCMLSNSSKTRFTLIDPYLPYADSVITQDDLTARKNRMFTELSQYNGRAKFLEMKSVDAAKLFPDESFDYVYLDGSHVYPEILKDLKTWFPKVKVGGILAGHDYFLSPVWDAVNEYLMVAQGMYVFCVITQTRKDLLIPANIVPYKDCCDWWVHKEVWEIHPIKEVTVGE